MKIFEMMKNTVMTGILLSLLTTVGWFCPYAGAEATILSYATNTEPTGLRGMAEKAFINEVERLGNGSIRVKAYWAQSLLKETEILQGIKDGTADMGHVNINYYPSRLMLNGAITLFQQGPSRYENRMWIYDTLYREIPELSDEFSRYNQKIIYTYSALPLAGAFTQPVTSLSDFKNRRIRASSHWLLKILEGAGAIPVSIAWSDTPMALQTNALEGTYTNLDAIHRTNLNEVAPHLLIFNEFWNPAPFHITMNLDSWNRLPAGTQRTLEVAAENAKKTFAQEYRSIRNTIISDLKSEGSDVTFASPEDIRNWLSLPELDQVKALWVRDVINQMPSHVAWTLLRKMESIIARGIRKTATHPLPGT